MKLRYFGGNDFTVALSLRQEKAKPLAETSKLLNSRNRSSDEILQLFLFQEFYYSFFCDSAISF